jgi:hypothetical protein
MSKAATEIHAQVMAAFTYAPDTETFGRFEHWQSFADEVASGHRITWRLR